MLRLLLYGWCRSGLAARSGGIISTQRNVSSPTKPSKRQAQQNSKTWQGAEPPAKHLEANYDPLRRWTGRLDQDMTQDGL